MGMLNIDTSNPEELLKKRVFEPVPVGVYVFEVANDLVVTDSKSTPGNKVVKIELRVIDDGEFKGRKVFDNLVILKDLEKKKKTEWKIAQFAVSCGVCTKDTLDEINLELFKGSICKAEVGIQTSEYQGETKKKNVVKNYLIEA